MVRKVVYTTEDLRKYNNKDMVEVHTLDGVLFRSNEEILGDHELERDSFHKLFWHREDGPAVIFLDGTQQYWTMDKLHRLNGPAYIGANGRIEFHFNSRDWTLDVLPWAKENVKDIMNFTEEEVFLMLMMFPDIQKEPIQ